MQFFSNGKAAPTLYIFVFVFSTLLRIISENTLYPNSDSLSFIVNIQHLVFSNNKYSSSMIGTVYSSAVDSNLLWNILILIV